ncbi:MAG: hypothetical protein WA782_05590 [Sulfitobacter sp.]|tara:strand:+ start:112 stop:456 length:345 start_codon:yes stop_codon:yes gene_type:complete
MKARFTKAQIIAIIEEQTTAEQTNVCRWQGISAATSIITNRNMVVSNFLRVLEDKIGKLKMLLAEQMLGNAISRQTPHRSIRLIYHLPANAVGPRGDQNLKRRILHSPEPDHEY